MAQAWKKTDSYIRDRNSYADILELEETSLCLPEKLQEWSEQIDQKDHSQKQPLRYVPCPKTFEWEFKKSKTSAANGWGAIRHKTKVPALRPLAHLSVRDQVLASTVMLCLADAVESMQGNTDPSSYSTEKETRKHVVSYGNRLFCDWHQHKPSSRQHARFRWGNASLYSKYFTDYQRFLERPVMICREQSSNLEQHLYIVKLDLEKFYDTLDQAQLLKSVENLYERYCGTFSLDLERTPDESKNYEDFCKAAGEILKWAWDSKDTKNNDLKIGIPQGLVTGGFFANAYMYELDEQIKSTCGTSFSDPFEGCEFKLIDYCRYVDDIRLVVSLATDTTASIAQIQDCVCSWFDEQICTTFKTDKGRPSLQQKKTEVIQWQDFTVNGSTSKLMQSLQTQISQAPDQEVLIQATASLDHLLVMAESPTRGHNDGNVLSLAHISRPHGDVRDDTVKRFLANRYRKVLRERRFMADSIIPLIDDLLDGFLTEQKVIDHEIETVARKLVAVWSKDPSLVSVLRCGLDLWPSSELLVSVIEALEAKIGQSQRHDLQKYERLAAIYVASEIFKAATFETGLGETDAYPESTDITQYRNLLLQFGLRLIKNRFIPWYLQQQVSLFLAAINYSTELPNIPELKNYRLLHKAFNYKNPTKTDDPVKTLLYSIIVTRQHQQWDRFGIWFGHWLNDLESDKQESLIDRFVTAQPDKIASLLHSWPDVKTSKKPWFKRLSAHYQPVPEDFLGTEIEHWPNTPIPLTHVIQHPENPFCHENALTKLATILLDDSNKEILTDTSVSLSNLSVSCNDWNEIQNPGIEPLIIKYKAGNSAILVWNAKPKWILKDKLWAYSLGRILRAATIGETDFTSRNYVLRENQPGGYQGLNSSWYKRRMGLIPITTNLGKEPTPMSPWMNHTIMSLLQWPGLEIMDENAQEY
jgi:hypothetical protein